MTHNCNKKANTLTLTINAIITSQLEKATLNFHNFFVRIGNGNSHYISIACLHSGAPLRPPIYQASAYPIFMAPRPSV